MKKENPRDYPDLKWKEPLRHALSVINEDPNRERDLGVVVTDGEKEVKFTEILPDLRHVLERITKGEIPEWRTDLHGLDGEINVNGKVVFSPTNRNTARAHRSLAMALPLLLSSEPDLKARFNRCQWKKCKRFFFDGDKASTYCYNCRKAAWAESNPAKRKETNRKYHNDYDPDNDPLLPVD